MKNSIFFRILLLALVLYLAGCSTYDQKLDNVFQSYYSKNPQAAFQTTKSTLQGLSKSDDDRPLFLMEHASIALALHDCKEAISSLQEADDMTEVMDLSGNPGEVGKYLFSDSSGMYRLQPHEQIQVNVLNSINYLLLGDLMNANVELKRAQTQEDYWVEMKSQREAKNHLLQLLGYSVNLHLNQRSNADFYRRTFISDYGDASFVDRAPEGDEKEILVLVLNGKAPVKKEMRERIPGSDIARIISHTGFTGDYLIYPKLVQRDSPFHTAEVMIQGNPVGFCANVLDIEAQALARDQQMRDKIMIAAATRMAIRAAASTAAAVATEQSLKGNNRQNDQFAHSMGMLVGSLTKSTMEAVDRADTRCWTLLPKNILAKRVVGNFPNDVTVSVTLSGSSHQQASKKISFAPNQKLAVVVFIAPSSGTIYVP